MLITSLLLGTPHRKYTQPNSQLVTAGSSYTSIVFFHYIREVSPHHTTNYRTELPVHTCVPHDHACMNSLPASALTCPDGIFKSLHSLSQCAVLVVIHLHTRRRRSSVPALLNTEQLYWGKPEQAPHLQGEQQFCLFVYMYIC